MQVIYGADNWSMYSWRPPKLSIAKYAGGTGQRVVKHINVESLERQFALEHWHAIAKECIANELDVVFCTPMVEHAMAQLDVALLPKELKQYGDADVAAAFKQSQLVHAAESAFQRPMLLHNYVLQFIVV